MKKGKELLTMPREKKDQTYMYKSLHSKQSSITKEPAHLAGSLVI